MLTSEDKIIYPAYIEENNDISELQKKSYGGWVPLLRLPNSQVNLVTISSEKGKNFQNPHSHNLRSKTCVVASGSMTLRWRCPDTGAVYTERIRENYSITIRPNEIHEIYNEGVIPLKILEIQTANSPEDFSNNTITFYESINSPIEVPLKEQEQNSEVKYTVNIPDLVQNQDLETIWKSLKKSQTLNVESRPWGDFAEILKIGQKVCVKIIRVLSIDKASAKNPEFSYNEKDGVRLSLQYHHHRTEHWIFTGGMGEVTKQSTHGKKEKTTKEVFSAGRSTFIDMLEIHRVTNKSLDKDLYFIEIQLGPFLSEDDNVRVEDDFKRDSPHKVG